MITQEETEGLRSEEKDAILDAILGMAWSDGQVQVEELDFLKQIARFFSDKEIEELIKDYKPDSARVGRKIAQSDLGGNGKKLLLRGMQFVAAAEGNLDDKELAFYRGCVRAFGIPDRVRERMEQEVNREVFTDFLRKRLLQNELDAPARELLGKLRQRLNLEEKWAEDQEKMLKLQIGSRK